jgi:hypothetical protein
MAAASRAKLWPTRLNPIPIPFLGCWSRWSATVDRARSRVSPPFSVSTHQGWQSTRLRLRCRACRSGRARTLFRRLRILRPEISPIVLAAIERSESFIPRGANLRQSVPIKLINAIFGNSDSATYREEDLSGPARPAIPCSRSDAGISQLTGEQISSEDNFRVGDHPSELQRVRTALLCIV